MAGALLFGLVMLPFGWTTPTLLDVALLMLLGVAGAGAHLMVTHSLALAPAAVVVPWQYAMILWGILFGWMFFRRRAGAAHAARRRRDHRRRLLAHPARTAGRAAVGRRAPRGTLRLPARRAG
jgi:hypothetical protein